MPASCSYPEPARSIHAPTSHFLKIHLNIIQHLRLDLPCGLFPSGFPAKTQYTPLSPIRATSPTRLILLDLITRTILGEEYRSLSSSLCSFLHSLVTSSFLIFKFFYRNLEDKIFCYNLVSGRTLSKYAICETYCIFHTVSFCSVHNKHAQQVKICRHNTDNNYDTHIGTRYVILVKHWILFPDDGFTWTEKCWSSFYNFNYFNNLRIL